jgi:hypothetical protein
MPNVWSTTSRHLYESFYGPRTVDTEFNSKVEEIKIAEQNVERVKLLFHNLSSNFGGKYIY